MGVTVPTGATSSNIIKLSCVSPFCNLSVAARPGAIFRTGPCPGSFTIPFASMAVPSQSFVLTRKPLSPGDKGAFPRSLWLVLAVISLIVRVAQHAAGQVAGVLALFHQHLAIDEGGVDAGRRLLEAPAARREVVDDEFRQRLHRVGVEDCDVGRHAGAQQPAVVKPEMRSGVEGQPAHGVFQAHDLLLAPPLAEEAGREAVTAMKLHMRAAIG